MYEKLYEMYERDKVPAIHHVPKIPVDTWQPLAQLVRTEEAPDAWRLYFRGINGQENGLTVRFPALGGVRLTGERQGYFTCDCLPVTCRKENGACEVFAQNGLSVRLTTDPFRLELRQDGQTFLTLDGETVSYGYFENVPKRVAITLPLAGDEKISGFGEKYNTLNQAGHLLPLHNDDTGYHGHPEEGDKCRSYKNVPIFHSSRGYTLFNNSFYSAIADLTSGVLRLDFNAPLLDLFIWHGPVSETLDSYTALTGRPVLPPKWAFEFWAGGGGGNWNRDGKDKFAEVFREAVDGYVRMGTIPSAFYGEAAPSQHAECYDMVHKIGSRMLAWNHPGTDIYITHYDAERIRSIFPGIRDEDIPMFRNAETGELFGRRLFYIDYSHPYALRLMRDKYAEFKKLGLKGAMVDYGEYVEQFVRAYNGMLGDEMHNFYGYCYSKTLHDVWQEISPDDHILFARAACAGTQRWLCFFGGDQRGTFYGLRQAFYGGLNAALSGFTIWGSDIGSLSPCDSGELYLRWLQFAAFSPLMRTHGNHNPWNYGRQSEEIFKRYFWARKNLLDYIYSAVITTHLKGTPIMRMMSAAYPEDRALLSADDQYLFGDDLMVCPVLYEGMTERDVRLPGGEWIELATLRRHTGGKTVRVNAPIETCPVFLRAGAVIPVTVSAALRLAAPIEGEGVRALLFAAGEGETLHRESETKSYRFRLQKSGDGYVLGNPDGYAATAVLICGDVTEARADGVGLTIERSGGISAVRLPGANWKELKIR